MPRGSDTALVVYPAGYTIYEMPSGSRNMCGLLDIAVACGVRWKEVSRLELQVSTSETQQNRVEATLNNNS